jgi:hypothetical protein
MQIHFVVAPTVHDSRIGERSPDNGKWLSRCLIVHDLVRIQEIQAKGKCSRVDHEPEHPSLIGDPGVACAYIDRLVDRFETTAR